MFNKLGNLWSADGYILPRQGHSMCYWGGSSSPDTSGAQATIAAGGNNATNAINDYYTKASAYLAPWRDAGGAAVNQIGGLLNLPGYTALDPTKTLEGTPGYSFLQNQGNQALSRYGAATGLSMSGAGAKGALNYGQNLAQTYAWAPYMSSLQNLSGQGLGAAGTSGQYAMQAGGQTANAYTQTAQQIAQLQQQQAQWDAQNKNSGQNDWMSALGFAGGLALAPFTGGTSLIGSGVSALSGMFGGSSGGSGGDSLYGTSNAYGGSGGGSYGSMPMWDVNMFKADGGPADANRPYIVGERGPELFIPRTAGYVVPNEYTRYSSFGGRG